MTVTMQEAHAERLEAEIRRRMAKVARMEVRGFDSRRAKDAEIAIIDQKLDELAGLG